VLEKREREKKKKEKENEEIIRREVIYFI